MLIVLVQNLIPTGRFPNKTTGIFMYNTSIVSTGCWQMIYSFNSDTYNRLYQTTQVLPGENVSQYGLVWGKTDGKYYLIKSGATYDIRHPILWASTALTSGTGNVNLDQQYTSVSLTNTISGKTVTANKKVYVKGTLDKNQFTVHSDVFVSEDNLTDGYYYVPIGTSYSTTQIRFTSLDMNVYKYTTSDGLVPLQSVADTLAKRYDGNFIGGVPTVNKPYLRLFNLKAKNSDSSSSHIIFEIIGNNNDRLYAKIRVDMRQNTSTTNSSYTVTPLEVYGFNLNELYFGFRNAYPNTSLDIFRKVGAYTNFYIRYADDHTRDGTVTIYSPVVNSTESYTDLTEASTALYNTSYTATSQGGTYDEVTNTIPYTNVNANKFVKRGGTSGQFLKADGSVDSNTYLTTSNASSTYLSKTDASSTYQPKGNYLTSHQNITGKADKTNGASQITDTNANNYTNIGSLASGATQQAINSAINTKMASLTNIDLVKVVTSLPTASASTMNQLYVVAKTSGGKTNDNYNIYVTIKNGSTYSWDKLDDFDLQTLSIAWGSVTGKPTIDTTVANNANNLVTSQAVYNALNGKANSSHTHPDTQITWTGSALAGQVSPLDMATGQEFNANRLAYLPSSDVTVEYSTDGGSTWTPYSTTDANKTKLVTTNASAFVLGHGSTTDYSKNKLQITIDVGGESGRSDAYFSSRKLLIDVSTNGATGTKVDVLKATYANPDTFTTHGSYNVSGYSGWNSIPFANNIGHYNTNQTTYIRKIRLVFSQTGGTANMWVDAIRMFGETAWAKPSNLATNGHLYSYDEYQNAFFPNRVDSENMIGTIYVNDDLELCYNMKSYYRSYTNDEDLGDLLPSKKNPFAELTTSSNGLKISSSSSEKWVLFPVTNFTEIQFTYVSGILRGMLLAHPLIIGDYIWLDNNGTTYAIHYGNSTVIASKTNVTTATNGDIFKITISNTTVSFYKNNELLCSGAVADFFTEFPEYYFGFYTNEGRDIVIKDLIIK